MISDKPDSSNHNPDPVYLRGLLEQVGLSVPTVAQQIGISDRMLRYYLTPPESGKKFQTAPYPVQFCLESLAAGGRMKPDSSHRNPSHAYLRGLLEQVGLSVPKVAQQIGISDRMLNYYLTPPESGRKFQVATYPVQFCLESLVAVDISAQKPKL